ncbi:MAG: hypothetical protein AB8I08_39090 [Sandaracinaceae bacterium]
MGSPAALAVLFWLALPEGALPPAGEAMLEGSLLGVGLAPLLIALAWLTARKHRRDPSSFAARAEEAELRRDEIESDLARTEARIRTAKYEMEQEQSARLLTSLRAELQQDRRLRKAQRRLVRQLDQRLQQLGVERFRGELLYFEAHREDAEANPEIAMELARKIEDTRDQHGEGGPAWEQALEDARALHHQLSRGIERLAAARRLDPLRYADLTPFEPEDALSVDSEGDLGGQIEHHLERIDRGFEALDELRRELSGDADASGLRMRVDDDVLAALDAEEEELLIDEGARISVTGL